MSTSQLPSYEQIVALHRKYAPSEAAFESVFGHCQIIWEIAEQLIQRSDFKVDAELVKVGCLLHDIGVYKLYQSDDEVDWPNYIKHGIFGHELLEQEGFNEEIYRIASHHTGVGLTKQGILDQHLPLPANDYLAETAEERLVMYADKFHSKSTPPKFTSVDTYRAFTGKFGRANTERFEQLEREFGVPNLAPLARKYNLETA